MNMGRAIWKYLIECLILAHSLCCPDYNKDFDFWIFKIITLVSVVDFFKGENDYEK